MLKRFRCSGYAMTLLLSVILAACTVSPSDTTIRRTIEDYVRSRGYEVIRMEIEAVESQSMSEKRYMGTDAVHVKLSSIVITRLAGSSQNEGKTLPDHVTFRYVDVTIKQGTGEKKTWTVADIRGMDLL